MINPFCEALLQLNAEYRERVSGPVRSKYMMFTVLSLMDAYKLLSGHKESTTEAEFLDMCKRWYWDAQEALHTSGPAALPKAGG